MKVFILGVGKSGTTALTYKVAGGLPNCQAFSGGRPGKYLGNYENAVYKHTYEERKGKSFEIYQKHLEAESYDRYIWIARDPRDSAVSRMLYRWHRGYKGKKAQFQAHLDLVLKKEQDPRSIPFYEICRYTGHNSWPVSTEEVIAEERNRCERMSEFVKNLGNEWFVFKFEDMVANEYSALNTYLGFEVQAETEVPVSTGKAKVIRKKASGDWRHWFTPEDVDLYKPAYLPYLEAIGYDRDDWELSPNPLIEPEYSSVYMQNLPKKNTINSLRSLKDLVKRRFAKKKSVN
jgi:hypothetical protein